MSGSASLPLLSLSFIFPLSLFPLHLQDKAEGPPAASKLLIVRSGQRSVGFSAVDGLEGHGGHEASIISCAGKFGHSRPRMGAGLYYKSVIQDLRHVDPLSHERPTMRMRKPRLKPRCCQTHIGQTGATLFGASHGFHGLPKPKKPPECLTPKASAGPQGATRQTSRH